MDSTRLRQLLVDLSSGQIGVDGAFERLRSLPFDDLEFARLDTHREIRQGLPEVVFCEGKTPEQIIRILERLHEDHDRVLATRASGQVAAAVREAIPATRYDEVSRLLMLDRSTNVPDRGGGYVMVVTGGTSDLPVAEEAAKTVEFFGGRVERAFDVGVAGVHRVLSERGRLSNAEVIICVAGMEGALTSVVGGLVSCPIVSVPTSVGYGASFEGLAALLTMLNSCAPGIAVVNIDNGFGAGLFAHRILQRMGARKTE